MEFLDLVPSMSKGKTLAAGYTLHSRVRMARTSLRTPSLDSPICATVPVRRSEKKKKRARERERGMKVREEKDEDEEVWSN